MPLQSLTPNAPLAYSSLGFARLIALEPWVVNDAVADDKGDAASLKDALLAL